MWLFCVSNTFMALCYLFKDHFLEMLPFVELDEFMKNLHFGPDVQTKLRSFFYQSKPFYKAKRKNDLLKQLTPLLKAQVEYHTHREVINKISIFKKCSTRFAVAVAMELKTKLYISSDMLLEPFVMYIIQKGVVYNHKRLLRKGDIVGEDLILETMELRRLPKAICTTLVETLELPKERLKLLLELFPLERKAIRRIQILWGLLREFQYIARHYRAFLDVLKKQEDPSSEDGNLSAFEFAAKYLGRDRLPTVSFTLSLL